MRSIKISHDIANLIGLDKPQGLLVVDVISDSPADKAGIRGGYMTFNSNKYSIKLGGDIILAVDNQNLTNSESITKNKRIGENITLTIIRDGKIKQIIITPENKPPDTFFYKNLLCGQYNSFKNLVTKSAEYTIIIYITASDLQDNVVDDILEMKNIGNFSKVNILLQTGGDLCIQLIMIMRICL